jgi:hypothetical protein
MHPLQPGDYTMPSWLQDELEFISSDYTENEFKSNQ